jgi:hypothetical protein
MPRPMPNPRRKLFPALAMIVLCGFPASLYPPQATAQKKTQPEAATTAAEAPEVATRFSDTVRPKNAKGAAVPLKVEVKDWTVTYSPQAFEMPDQGFCIVHLTSGQITTEIAGKSTPRHTGDFWVVEKGQHMSISLQPPQESAGLQTIAVSPGH